MTFFFLLIINFTFSRLYDFFFKVKLADVFLNLFFFFTFSLLSSILVYHVDTTRHIHCKKTVCTVHLHVYEFIITYVYSKLPSIYAWNHPFLCICTFSYSLFSSIPFKNPPFFLSGFPFFHTFKKK